MKTNSLNALWLGVAVLVMGSTPLWAQTSVPSGTSAVTPAPTAVSGPATSPASVPASLPPPAVPAPAVPSAAPVITAAVPVSSPPPAPNPASSTGQETDPAVTAVLDRLKQDTTPLSISDMSSAQDALARLNLMKEIEQKLAEIEEARAKRMGISGMAGLDTGAPLAPQQVFNQASGFGGAPSHHSAASAQILSISGSSGRYSATIDWNGREMIVKPGSLLPDGTKITRITASEVITVSHGKSTTLSFAEAKTADNGSGHSMATPSAFPSANPTGN